MLGEMYGRLNTSFIDKAHSLTIGPRSYLSCHLRTRLGDNNCSEVNGDFVPIWRTNANRILVILYVAQASLHHLITSAIKFRQHWM